MMWKKFTVSLWLTLSAALSFACAFYDVPQGNFIYMFKTYDYDENNLWNDIYYKPKQDNISFWFRYSQGRVDKKSIEQALYQCGADEIGKGNNRFFAYLNETGDADALHYWTINKTFSEKTDDPWYYPNRSEKQKIAALADNLEKTLSDCKSELLKERFVYLTMRISFYVKQYESCKTLWEQHRGNWHDSELRRKCLLYYAGALFYTGENAKAADIYADNGDWISLLSFDKSVDFMRELYAASPSSKAFMFFVQKYVNRYQDKQASIDCSDFTALCRKVVSEKKSDNPALWQSALAHIAFLQGDVKKAVELIEKASGMKGYPMTMENIRMLQLLYHAADHDATDYDKKMYNDLPWLLEKVSSLDNYWADNGKGYEHHLHMLSRIILRHAFPHYVKSGNSNMAAALLNAYDEAYCDGKEKRDKMRRDPADSGSYEYYTHYFRYLDTTSIENVKKFLTFVKSGGKTPLEKSLIRSGYVSESMMNELIGTKYMRIYDYTSAISYLEKVKPFFWKKQNITENLTCNPFREKWIGSDSLRGGRYRTYNPAEEYDRNPGKLQFCKIMHNLEQRQLTMSDVEDLAEAHYAYAVGVAQAGGWCWALTEYATGSMLMGSFCSFSNGEKLKYENNGWDYMSSKSYMLQQRCKIISTNLAAAENRTTDREFAARCRYMRASTALEPSQAQHFLRQLTSNYSNTQFVSGESRHCDILSDYK